MAEQDRQDWLDARDALQMLWIGEAELQTLVASGSLRAFRAAGTMKFRREDVAAMKLASAAPTIIPPTVNRPSKSGVLPTVADMDGAPTIFDCFVSGEVTRVSETPAPAAPAASSSVSKIRATPGSRVIRMASSRRAQPVFRYKPAHPLLTALLLINSLVLTFSGSLGFIMLNVGYYDRAQEQRIIPPYINQHSSTPVYRWCYHNTPGDPQDVKPLGEYDGQ